MLRFKIYKTLILSDVLNLCDTARHNHAVVQVYYSLDYMKIPNSLSVIFQPSCFNPIYCTCKSNFGKR